MGVFFPKTQIPKPTIIIEKNINFLKKAMPGLSHI